MLWHLRMSDNRHPSNSDLRLRKLAPYWSCPAQGARLGATRVQQPSNGAREDFSSAQTAERKRCADLEFGMCQNCGAIFSSSARIFASFVMPANCELGCGLAELWRSEKRTGL